MKFLKSLFLKFKGKKTLTTYQKPLLVTLLTLFLANVALLFIGAGVGLALDNNLYGSKFFGGSYISAFIGSVRWMVSPNSLTLLSVREDLAMMVLAILMVVLGMVLFSGAIIATVTTSLRAYIDRKSHAKGRIFVENHFVILNWNSKVPDMINNLMVKGFEHNIVILSPKNKEYIESEIRSLLLANEVTEKMKVNLIIKEGDPLLRTNLEDISIDRAKQICVMASDDVDDVDDDGIINHDLLNLKIALRLGSFKIREDCQIVIETDSDETRGQIENLSHRVNSLKRLSIIPVSFNKKIGQIIAQSLVTPAMSGLYSTLFSFGGSEFYSIESDEDIRSFMAAHSCSIPVYKENRLFVLAEDEGMIEKCRKVPYETSDSFKPIGFEKIVSDPIFIIGDSKKKRFVLESLSRSKEYGNAEFQIHYYEKRENDRLIKDLRANPGPKKVLILSDDSAHSESYDANVFVTLIELSKAFPGRENITFITELLDSRNRQSIQDFNIKNTIIPNQMMSLLITQLALNRDSKLFYERVLATANSTKEGEFDLVINRVDKTIEIEKELHLSSKAELLRTFYNTFKGDMILIGLFKDDKFIFLDKEQDKKEDIVLRKEDSFIYFKKPQI